MGLFQILNWKSAAVKTQCWRKEIGQAMVLKVAETPKMRKRRKKKKKKKKKKKEKKKHRGGPNSFITVISNGMLFFFAH